jgi:hypothetical protein
MTVMADLSNAVDKGALLQEHISNRMALEGLKATQYHIADLVCLSGESAMLEAFIGGMPSESAVQSKSKKINEATGSNQSRTLFWKKERVLVQSTEEKQRDEG